MKKLISLIAVLVIMSGCNLPQVEENNNLEEATNIEQIEGDTKTLENVPVGDKDSIYQVALSPEETLETDNSLTPEQTMSINQTDLPQTGEKIATMVTSMGTVKIRLFEKQVPKTVENFIGLAEKGYYDGVIFHRVIPDFMIQGGDPTGTGMGGESFWGGKFEDEFVPELNNIYGALSMANAGPGTNGSQFFIVQNQDGTAWLDGKHSVFGQVFEGMDIVNAIATVERNPSDKPLEDITINSVLIETQA